MDMYAIVQTGGKQYKVVPGEQIKVEKLDAEPGSQVRLNEVLAVSSDDGMTVGTPLIEGGAVAATVVRTAKDRKIIVFKKKRRKGYHKKQGHRQWFTLLRIDGIETSGSARSTDAPAETPAETETPAQPEASPDTTPEM
jgi:large subunit ribosomal protein L21